MENVVVSSEARYNVFSVTAMLKKEWSLKGNAEQLMITRENVKVNFDIKIKRLQGILFLLAIKREKSQNYLGMLVIPKWIKADAKTQNFIVSALPGPGWKHAVRRKGALLPR